MNLFRFKKTPYAVTVLFLLCTATAQGQSFGALQHLLQKRPANERFQSNNPNEHLFISGSAGMNHLLTGSDAQEGISWSGNFFVGKWLTPIHGLRLGFNESLIKAGTNNAKIRTMGGSLDYLLNISALGWGYNEQRPFEMLFVTGGEIGYSKVNQDTPHSPSACYYGLYLGLQGNVRLTSTLDFFIEPRIGIYSDTYTHTEHWRNYKQRLSVLAGLTYTPAAPMGTRIHFDSFEHSRLYDHLFVSVSGGIGFLKNGGWRNSLSGLGPQGAFSIGRWMTPVSGLRLTGGMGYGNTPENSDARRLKHIDFRTDYLLNLNNLLWGYDDSRLFTLSGVVGLNLAATKGVKNHAQYAAGAGLGVQGSFRLNRSLDFFIEPRINLYTNHYAGGQRSWGGDQTTELNIGFTYHAVEREARSNQPFSKRFCDQVFMTSGIGVQLFMNRENLQHGGALGPQLTLSVGKWFSPSSGLRLTGTAGYFGNYYGLPADIQNSRLRHASVSAGIDYLWNITHTLNGYNPDRVFELIGALGAQVAYTSRSNHQVQPGVTAGLQTLWHLNDFLGIYVEPQVRMYGDKFIEGNLGFMQKDVLASIQAGFHYRFAPYTPQANRAAFEQNSRRWFVSAAAGMGTSVVANRDLFKQAGVETRLAVGHWYTPLSAWRITGTYLNKPQKKGKPELQYGGISAEYMMSLATLAKGYRANTVLDVLPFVGLTGGVSHRMSDNKFVVGLDAGAQIRFRVAPDWGLFAEPRVGIRTDHYDGYKQHRADRVASLTTGVTYQF